MRVLVIPALVMLLGAGSASAADTYAAIALNQKSGATGYGYRFTSRSGAEERALQQCGSGCIVVAWVRNQCLSLATGRSYGYGYALSTNDATAMQRAVAECGKRTSNCEVNTTICSSRLPGG